MILESLVPIVLGTFQSAQNFGHWKVFHFRSRNSTGFHGTLQIFTALLRLFLQQKISAFFSCVNCKVSHKWATSSQLRLSRIGILMDIGYEIHHSRFTTMVWCLFTRLHMLDFIMYSSSSKFDGCMMGSLFSHKPVFRCFSHILMCLWSFCFLIVFVGWYVWYVALNFYIWMVDVPLCLPCSRMRSKGSRFTLGVWGLRLRSPDNRSQPFTTIRVMPVWPCLWRVLQTWSILEVSKVA